jgi:hypothetical protein
MKSLIGINISSSISDRFLEEMRLDAGEISVSGLISRFSRIFEDPKEGNF